MGKPDPIISPSEPENELYAGLSETARKDLSSRGRIISCARGTRLVQKGVLPQGVIILNSGTADIIVVVGGKEMPLGVAGPGKVFGLHFVMTGTAPDTTVTCLEDCRVTTVPKDIFLEVLKLHPEMYIAVGKVLSADLSSANRLIRACARGVHPKSGKPSRPA